MKYGLIFIFIVLVSAALLTGCSNDPVVNSSLDTTTFTYPMQNGNKWSYTKRFLFTDFRPDSIRSHFDTGYWVDGRIEILYDTVINSIAVKCFYETIINHTPDTSYTTFSRSYYADTDSGLVLYAWRQAPGTGVPLDNNGINFNFRGASYQNPQDLVSGMDGSFYNYTGGGSDSLHMYNPPVLILKYPTRTGTTWTVQNKFVGTITRTYMGYEFLTLPFGVHKCMKLKREFELFDDYTLYQHYSMYGLLRTDLFLDNVEVTNEIGVKIGYVDIRELNEVTSYTVNAE
jgi:hypothetical protein